MKKLSSLILAFFFLASFGCANLSISESTETTSVPATIEITYETETTTRQIDNMQNKDKVQTEIDEIFYLGQSPDEVLNVFKKEGIEIDMEGREDKNGRRYEWDGHFSLISDELNVFFNPNEEITRINVKTPRYATDLGIRVGDSKEKMLEVYGENYTLAYENSWYIYTYNDLCIGFLIRNNTVEWWNIYIPSDQSSPP